jgi:hypothetical protein
LVQLAFNFSEHIARITELAVRYCDRHPHLADLCLIRMSELHPKYPVVTIDVADFRVYRRNQREMIPIVHPPAR